VPAGFAARAPMMREGDGDQGFEWAQRESFENTRDLLGDLLGAKNAGVTRRQGGRDPEMILMSSRGG
jgi:hypothetical protein